MGIFKSKGGGNMKGFGNASKPGADGPGKLGLNFKSHNHQKDREALLKAEKGIKFRDMLFQLGTDKKDRLLEELNDAKLEMISGLDPTKQTAVLRQKVTDIVELCGMRRTERAATIQGYVDNPAIETGGSGADSGGYTKCKDA